MNIQDNDSYASIFDQRGQWYHQAMEQIPDSRKEEFQLLFNKIQLNPGDKCLDFPSGGGYLGGFLPENVKLFELEVSKSFAKVHDISIGSWDHLPFENNFFNVVFCCAAFHHVNPEMREKYLAESHRVLKPGGILSIADANVNSPVAEFLNGYVNENNSMGHHGVFLDENSAEKFAGSSFKIIRNKICEYNWYLAKDKSSSLQYLKLMFGLDKAIDEDLFEYLTKNLNFRINNEARYSIDWSLRYILLEEK